MTLQDCFREPEVTETVVSGQWPDRCSDELRSHVQSCGYCSEIVKIAVVLREHHAGLLPEVRLPSAGGVWWRAELRARGEAARAVERPLTLAHAFAGAAAFGVLLAVLVQLSSWFFEMFSSVQT